MATQTKRLARGKFRFVSWLAMAAVLLAACGGAVSDSQVSLQATILALSAQGTSVALQATQDAINLQSSSLAQQATLLAQPTPLPPEVSLAPTIIPITPTLEAPATSATPNPEIEARIKAAKILLFEDTSGNQLGLLRYVKEALDLGGYSYVDVGSAQGWLKDKLISDEEWDLIILASEVSGRVLGSGSGRISGEYYNYIKDRLDGGAAVIMETWNLDDISQGNVRRILDECGVEFEADWLTPPSNSVWFLAPEHPVFHYPNEIGPSLRDYEQRWSDSGDLIQIKNYAGAPAGDATLLAGARIDDKRSHGLLAECLGGRMIIQTFATHHHNQEDIVKLWQNYVYYTLKNHFEYLGE